MTHPSTVADTLDAGDGWITWAGGECPVAGDTVVQVCIGVNEPHVTEPDEADVFFWKHEPGAIYGDYHITAYRVVQP